MRAANEGNIRPLRNNLNLYTTTRNFDRQNKVTEAATISWNEIPNIIKSIKNRDTFKLKYETQLMEKYNTEQ